MSSFGPSGFMESPSAFESSPSLDSTWSSTSSSSGNQLENNVSSDYDVVSEHMLKFNDVAELQQSNVELLRVIRKLTAGRTLFDSRATRIAYIEGEESESTFGANAAALETSNRELTETREKLSRMEEITTGLVQQRDLYRNFLLEVERLNN